EGSLMGRTGFSAEDSREEADWPGTREGSFCLARSRAGRGSVDWSVYVAFAAGTLEAVAAALALVSLQLFLHPQMGAVHSSCFQVEDHLALRLEPQQRHLIGQSLRQSFRLGGDTEDGPGSLEALAGVGLDAGIFLAGAGRGFERDVVFASP